MGGPIWKLLSYLVPCFPPPPLQATAFYISLGADMKNVLAFIGWLAGLAMVAAWGWLQTKFASGERASKELARKTDRNTEELARKTDRNTKELEHLGKELEHLGKEVAGLADLIKNEHKEAKWETKVSIYAVAGAAFFMMANTTLGMMARLGT